MPPKSAHIPSFKALLSAIFFLALLGGCAPAAPTAALIPTAPATYTPEPSATQPPLSSATPQPIATNTPQGSQPAGNSQIAEILTRIDSMQAIAYIQSLTGETQLSLGESPVWIESRDDEENLQEVTQALYDFLQDQGLSVRFQDWYDDYEEIGGRNVIAELPGQAHPEEIVILSAHLDSYCEERSCPGADDDASGAVGVLLAAQYLPEMRFERTLRFVFFTGEEIDLLGSYYYAEELQDQQENVVAVINLDMIAWDGDGDGTALLYTHPCGGKTCPGDAAIANAVIDAVETYGISGLYPRITSGDYDASDAYSFWEAGYPTILAIEDDQDEDNPYYHTDRDTLDTLDTEYHTAYIQAVIAAVAELAGPVEP